MIAAWVVLLTAGTVPVAHALGLPFVDLPTAGGVASDAIDSASQAIVNLISSSVASLTNEIIRVSDTVGAPQVGSNNTWFSASYKRTVGVSLYLMAIVSLIAITAAGIRGKIGDMAQVIFVGIPGSVVAMMLTTLGVQLALSLSDAMTAYTFGSSVNDIQAFLHDIGTVFTAGDGAGGAASATLAPGLVLIIGLLMIIAQIVILAVLIIRTALIYIVTLFLPLVFAMQVWPATRHMTRKALELLAVLILSKFAIFTCFALGASATADILNGPTAAGGPPAVQSAIVGFGVMLAAAFSPMLLMSIVPGIAGSFGAGMPGGTAGAGALGIQSPSQLMRSTLSSIHTVRGGSSGHSASNSSRSSSSEGRSVTPRPPSPPGRTGPSAGGAAGARGAAAAEQAHGATNAHPAAAAAMGATQVLAAGASSAAGAARSTTQQGMGSAGAHGAVSNGAGGSSGASAPTGSSSSGQGPHVVGERSDARGSSSSPSTESSGGRSPQQLVLPVDGGGSVGVSPDGFSRVNTRQPFTLETT
jgi:hypothetical protein